jgi:hypothetical protein
VEAGLVIAVAGSHGPDVANGLLLSSGQTKRAGQKQKAQTKSRRPFPIAATVRSHHVSLLNTAQTPIARINDYMVRRANVNAVKTWAKQPVQPKKLRTRPNMFEPANRGDWIRTSGLLLPKQAL